MQMEGHVKTRGTCVQVKDKWHDLSCHGKAKDGGAAMETVNPAAAGKE
jgi:hypothetical protein